MINIGRNIDYTDTSSVANGFKGYIYEILVFTRILSDSERNRIHYYFSKKWGIESRVDSDGDGTVDASDSDPLTASTISFTNTVNNQINQSDELGNVDADIMLWLDASNVDAANNATLSDGASISEWKDLSGNGDHAVASTVVVSSSIANQPVIDKSNNFITFNSETNNPLISPLNIDSSVLDKVTIFAVFSAGSDVINSAVWGQDDGGWDRLFILNNSTGTGLSNGSNVQDVPNLTSKLGTGLLIVESYYDEDEVGGSHLYLDGKLETTFTADNNIGQNTLSIGAVRNTTSPLLFEGNIAEVIVMDRKLTDDERAKINYYLSNKWGLESTVDSDGDGLLDANDDDPLNTAMVDLSDTVDAQIGEESGFDAIEGNLALWLDASNIDLQSNVTLSDGDAISEWNDLSGKNQHLSNSSVSQQPNYNGTGVVFDGNEFLSGTPTHLPTGNNSRTVYVVVDNVQLISNWNVVFHYGEEGTNNAVFDISLGTTGVTPTDKFLVHMWAQDYITEFSAQQNTPYMIMVDFDSDRASGLEQIKTDLNYYIDGAQYPWSGGRILDQDLNTGSSTLYVGRMASGYYLDGDILEIIVFDKILSDDERAKVNYYLSNKWGLESTVDSDGDSFTDSVEESAGTSPMDAADKPISITASVTNQIGEASELELLEEDLVLWLDATNIDMQSNATLSNGDAIAEWKNLAGKTFSPSQSTASYQPIFLESAMNSLAGVQFNQSNSQYLELDYQAELNEEKVTIFAVTKQDNQSSYGSIITSRQTDPIYGYIFYYLGDDIPLDFGPEIMVG